MLSTIRVVIMGVAGGLMGGVVVGSLPRWWCLIAWGLTIVWGVMFSLECLKRGRG